MAVGFLGSAVRVHVCCAVRHKFFHRAIFLHPFGISFVVLLDMRSLEKTVSQFSRIPKMPPPSKLKNLLKLYTNLRSKLIFLLEIVDDGLRV